ncbi:hypothetical protein A7U60_g4883 [Sanghuangporus baumii]|uniref:DUF6533 domain-containing protein n=1 Tax=Sanghuangporus baumii TaxID=108892 RepID=A0A9Q5HXP0_SANBA|nr:hypothetical protein A7U60_g4883 [Sanghuangporus baumii]
MSTIEAEIGNRLIDLNANRYLTAAGVFVLAYDSILTFPDEICYVWIPLIRDMRSRLRKGQNLETSRALSFSSFAHKSVLIVLRYVTLTVSSLFLYCTVLYRLYSLWDLDSRSARISLCGLAAITLFCAIVGISAIAKTQKHIILQHLGDIRSCSANDTAPLAIVAIGSILALDIVAFSLLLLNALSRPRTESQHLLRVLYQDGMIFFLATVAMRLMNVIIMANSISQAS